MPVSLHVSQHRHSNTGHADIYEKMKDVEETRTIELNEKGLVQTYRRGTIVLEAVSTKEVTTFEISPGKTIEVRLTPLCFDSTR